jgi:hypothetical protein
VEGGSRQEGAVVGWLSYTLFSACQQGISGFLETTYNRKSGYRSPFILAKHVRRIIVLIIVGKLATELLLTNQRQVWQKSSGN